MRRLKLFSLGLVSIIAILLIAIWFTATQPLLLSRGARSTAEVDPSRLETHVRMLSDTFTPRDYKHTGNLDRAAAYIQGEFGRSKGRVSVETYEVKGETYRNVVLALGPETRERIVVGAHYDAADVFPGADDNASGVAGLIELSRMLDTATLPMTVELVAYTLEEPPFFRTGQMGSAVHASSLRKQGVPVRMMISLEMIGYFSDDVGSQHYPLSLLKLFYPAKGNFITVIGGLWNGPSVRRVKRAMHRATELPVRSFNAPPSLVAGLDWSDHLNYWNNQYPAVMVTDTSFLRNMNYHTKSDTPEKLDYKRMSMVVKGAYEAVMDLAKD